MSSFFKKCVVILLTITVACILLIYKYFYVDRNPITVVDINSENIYVHFIDVGEGDCSLIQTNSGNLLIDAGTFESEKDIIDYMDALSITEFEYAIFTHPHGDHIGSAATLIEKYDFENVIITEAVHTTYSYESLISTLEKENCNIILAEVGEVFKIGDVTVELLAPDDYYDKEDLNNMSIVSKVTYRDVSFMFAGDAEEESEDAMLYYGYDLDADILKVAHHGSSTSSSERFIKATSPAVAIISAGKDNDYGHPHYEVVRRLEDINADIYVTYDVGNIIVSTDGSAFDIITEK